MKKITKVVIPIAGNGTRFLPITKTISKTLLPLIDKPVIQYLIEECVAAGITDVLLVLGPNQSDVMDYFDLESKYVMNLGQTHLELEKLKELLGKVNISYAIQDRPKGLADAVYKSKEFVNGDDFALILGDDLVISNEESYGIGSLCKYYSENNGYYLGVQEVKLEDTHKYGIIKPKSQNGNIYVVDSMIEKPKDNPPSNYACVGRYILKSSIFDAIEKITCGVGGELQLTDAINLVMKDETIYASTFNGKRYDVGSKREYVEAIKAVLEIRTDI